MNKKVEQIITDRIIAKLKEGTVPWRQPWTSEAPSNGISKKPYHGVNALMTGAAAYESAYWLTYKQAQSLGGQVRKGEKGTPIIYWNINEKKVKDQETGEEKIKKLFFLRYYTVFNTQQIDGLPERFEPVEKAPLPVEEWETNCQAIVDEYADLPHMTTGGTRAYYSPADDTVNLPARADFENATGYWNTMFHELTHSTGSTKRLDREMSMAKEKYSFEELIAELGACFLTARAGISDEAQLDQSAAYIKSWIRVLEDNPDWIIKAGSKAAKAVDYITQTAAEDVAVA